MEGILGIWYLSQPVQYCYLVFEDSIALHPFYCPTNSFFMFADGIWSIYPISFITYLPEMPE